MCMWPFNFHKGSLYIPLTSQSFTPLIHHFLLECSIPFKKINIKGDCLFKNKAKVIGNIMAHFQTISVV